MNSRRRRQVFIWPSCAYQEKNSTAKPVSPPLLDAPQRPTPRDQPKGSYGRGARARAEGHPWAGMGRGTLVAISH